MNFNEQMTVIRESMRAKRMSKDNRVRFISAEKWKAIMTRCLQKFKTKKIFDSNMVEDLLTIIDKITEDKFVQATLNIQPFKPSFISHSRREERKERFGGTTSEDLSPNPEWKYRQTITKFKHSVHQKLNHSDNEVKAETIKKSMLEQMLTLVTEQTTLAKEFESKYHPYRKIIEQFLFLLQHKYKLIMDARQQVEIEQIQQKLIMDLNLLQEFIVKSSEPYLAIFKSQNVEEKEMFQIKLIAFIRQYVQKHERINICIRKIMRGACRKSKLIKGLLRKMPDLAEINQFQIPEKYKIDGCYVYSMTTLMELAQTTTSLEALQKLREFRQCLSKDLDNYYKGQKAPSQMQITADTQLQIMKFVVVKVKSFLCEIYAQLKYLQVVCGQQDMSYKYDDSSYMYAQLSVAFEALELDYNQ